jgi:hypothetical protein
MKREYNRSRLASIISVMILLCVLFVYPFYGANASASVAEFDEMEEGIYSIDATLSCYVNAMGGIEFGAPLLTSAFITVDHIKNTFITLTFTKSSITIYGITCDIFIDAQPLNAMDDRGVKNGTIGYYDKDGELITNDVRFTLSSDTALNTASEDVFYVETITFPINYVEDTYNLAIYINSNVMGVQFCNSNDKATAATYPAVLKVDWNKFYGQDTSPSEAGEDESSNTATVMEEEGLNIHYADGANTLNDGKEQQIKSETKNPNSTVLIIVGAIGVTLVIIGTVILISTKKAKNREQFV